MDSQILKWEHVDIRTKTWTYFHRDLISQPDFRLREGMMIVDLRDATFAIGTNRHG
jgi:hypothetical protein